MRCCVKTVLVCVAGGIIFQLSANGPWAQSIGPAALTARQEIKAQVLAAMSDGKISQQERKDILVKAKKILTDKEYVGLVDTINRLSPPDKATPENLGYAPFEDKQLMANFPTWDLPGIEKLSKLDSIGSIGKLRLQKIRDSIDPIPQKTQVVREFITKETIAKETVPGKPTVVKTTTSKQTVAKDASAKQPAVKQASANQAIAKQTPTKQRTAKMAKAGAGDKVALIPPPPNNQQSQPSKVVKTENGDPQDNLPMPPLPSAERSAVRSAEFQKPIRPKAPESAKKSSAIADQVKIQQPKQLFNDAERPTIRHTYKDYSVPILDSPSAALLSDRGDGTIQASFEETLQPDETGQNFTR